VVFQIVLDGAEPCDAITIIITYVITTTSLCDCSVCLSVCHSVSSITKKVTTYFH